MRLHICIFNIHKYIGSRIIMTLVLKFYYVIVSICSRGHQLISINVSIFSKILETQSTINCLSISPRITFKTLSSLASKQHLPQKLPLWMLLRSFKLALGDRVRVKVKIVYPNYHQSLSSSTFQECLTQSITRCNTTFFRSTALQWFASYLEGQTNQVTWRYLHLLHADPSLVSHKAQRWSFSVLPG